MSNKLSTEYVYLQRWFQWKNCIELDILVDFTNFFLKKKNVNYRRVKFVKQKLFHTLQVTVTFYFYYGEISKIMEIGHKNLDFAISIDW